MVRNNQNGMISLFVLFAMLILLVFTIGIYYSVKSKAKLQESKNLEYQEIYSKNYDEISNVEYATENEIIPIYNIDELDIVGTNNFLQIKKKIYQCGREKSYVLKDNIIVDIEEKIKNKLSGFNDYKFYASTYLIDKASYDLYYYCNGEYWKTVAYKKYENNNFNIENEVYTEKEFLILNDLSFYSKEYKFLFLWSDENGDFTNEKVQQQNIYKTKLSSMDELDVFNKNKENLYEDGEYYIFISVGDSI